MANVGSIAHTLGLTPTHALDTNGNGKLSRREIGPSANILADMGVFGPDQMEVAPARVDAAIRTARTHNPREAELLDRANAALQQAPRVQENRTNRWLKLGGAGLAGVGAALLIFSGFGLFPLLLLAGGGAAAYFGFKGQGEPNEAQATQNRLLLQNQQSAMENLLRAERRRLATQTASVSIQQPAG